MKKKTVILYRVVQEWRAPVFEKLNLNKDLDIEVWHVQIFQALKLFRLNRDIFSQRNFFFSELS